MNTATRPALITTPPPTSVRHLRARAGGRQNFIAQAVAGSAEASTIIHAMSLLGPLDEDMIYFAFQQAYQVLEAEERSRGILCPRDDFNALGMRSLGRGYTLEFWKVMKARRRAERWPSPRTSRVRNMACHTPVDSPAPPAPALTSRTPLRRRVLASRDEHDFIFKDKEADTTRAVAFARDLSARCFGAACCARGSTSRISFTSPTHLDFRRA